MKPESQSAEGLPPATVLAWELRWWLAIFLAGGLGVGLAVLVLADPVYEAQVKVMASEIATNDSFGGSPLTALADIAGLGSPSSSTTKYEALEILRSTAFLLSFIEDSGLLPILRWDLWDVDNSKWRSQLWGDIPTSIDGARFFEDELLTIREDRRTGIVTIAVRWRNPDQAAEWANALVVRLNKVMRSRAIGDVNANLEYLDAQLVKTQSMEVKQAIFRLVEVEVKKAMIAEVREDYALRVIDPALSPTPDDKIWPQPVLALAGGISIGLLMATGFVLLYRLKLAIRRNRPADIENGNRRVVREK